MKNKISQDYIEAVYNNCRQCVNAFKADIKESLLEKPSVKGKINGMDFQQFAAYNAFFNLIQIEDAINDTDLFSKSQLKQIKFWAIQMQSEAKRVFQNDYDKWYNDVKKDES